MVAAFLPLQRANYLPPRAEILTQRSNLTPQRAKNTVNDLPVVPKSLLIDIKQLGFTPSFRNRQAAVGSLLQMEAFCLNLHCC